MQYRLIVLLLLVIVVDGQARFRDLIFSGYYAYQTESSSKLDGNLGELIVLLTTLCHTTPAANFLLLTNLDPDPITRALDKRLSRLCRPKTVPLVMGWQTNTSRFASSRLRLFGDRLYLWQWPRVNEYRFALHLDMDVLVLRDLHLLFAEYAVFREAGNQATLQFLPEGLKTITPTLISPWHITGFETPADLQRRQTAGIRPANAGIFLFGISAETLAHFKAFSAQLSSQIQDKYTDQPFVNHYFGERLLIDWRFFCGTGPTCMSPGSRASVWGVNHLADKKNPTPVFTPGSVPWFLVHVAGLGDHGGKKRMTALLLPALLPSLKLSLTEILFSDP